MSSEPGRIVPAVHGRRRAAPKIRRSPTPLAAWLQAQFTADGLVDLYARYMHGDDPIATAMRAVICRAAARRVGRGLQVGTGAGFKHLDTFEFGEGVFIGAQTYLQGRFDGTCVIGDHVWIGPQSYFDARDLVIEDYVGWGPGRKVLGSSHTALPDRRADHPDRSRHQAGPHRGVGRHRHQRGDSARRHRRPRQHRRRRRGRDARRAAVLSGRRACRHGSSARARPTKCAAAEEGAVLAMDALNLRNARALVTGGAGLIGSHIVDRLAARARVGEIVVLDNFSRGRRENLAARLPARSPSSKATSATARCVARRDEGHRRRLPSGGDPDHAMCRGTGAGHRCARQRHLQRPRGGPRRRRRARSSRPRPRRSTAWPIAFRPTSSTTPTTTARCTARPRRSTKGCCDRFNDQHGLDYVALRYFNVYGPRMDIHGAYTEVFIRWMENIAAGKRAGHLRRRPADDGLHQRPGRRPRQHPRRAGADHRRGLQRRDRHRSLACRVRRADAADDGLATRRSNTRRRAPSTRCRGGSPAPGAPNRSSASRRSCRSSRGCASWSAGGGRNANTRWPYD